MTSRNAGMSRVSTIYSLYEGGKRRDFFLKKMLNTLECPICLCFKGTYVLNCSHRVCEECVSMIYRTTQESKKRECIPLHGNKKRNRSNFKCAYCSREYEWSYSFRKQERICRIDLDARNIMNVTRQYVERDDLCGERHGYLPMNILCVTCNNSRLCALCYVEDHKSHECTKSESFRWNGLQDFLSSPQIFLFRDNDQEQEVELLGMKKSNNMNLDLDHKKIDYIFSAFCPTLNDNLYQEEMARIVNMIKWPKFRESTYSTTITRGSLIAYIDNKGTDGCFAALGICNAPDDLTYSPQGYRINADVQIFKLMPLREESKLQGQSDMDATVEYFFRNEFEIMLDSSKQVKIQDILMHGLNAHFHEGFKVEFSPLLLRTLKYIFLHNYRLCCLF